VLLPATQPMALPHELGQLQRLRHRVSGLALSALRRRAVRRAPGRLAAPRRHSLRHRSRHAQRRRRHSHCLRPGPRPQGRRGHRLLSGNDQCLHRQPHPRRSAQQAHSRRCLCSRLPTPSDAIILGVAKAAEILAERGNKPPAESVMVPIVDSASPACACAGETKSAASEVQA